MERNLCGGAAIYRVWGVGAACSFLLTQLNQLLHLTAGILETFNSQKTIGLSMQNHSVCNNNPVENDWGEILKTVIFKYLE